MKLLTFILTINAIACFGQNLYVDNITKFSWTSDEHIDQKAAEIGLFMLRSPKDSLRINRIIWTFKDDLTLNYYNAKDRSEKLVLKCKYDIDAEKGLINIEWPDTQRSTYRYNFISTGSYMSLTRKKIKSER